MDDSLARFCDRWLRPADGRALIVGSSVKLGRQDRRVLYSNALGVDMEAGHGVDLVHNMEDPLPGDMVGAFGHVECTSVMEHSRKPWMLGRHIEDALRIGGTLLLSVPFIWRQHAYPSDYFRFTAEGVRELFPRITWAELIYMGMFDSHSPQKALDGFRHNGHPFYARTEVYGFGVRV